MKYCSDCNLEYADVSKFCKLCGAALKHPRPRKTRKLLVIASVLFLLLATGLVVMRDGYDRWKHTFNVATPLVPGNHTSNITQTSAPVVVDQKPASADADIKNSLKGWAQTSRNRDIDGHLQYYADTLDFYYNRTMVPASKVREDRSRAFAKFNDISIQLANINVELDSTGQRATVALDKTFDFRGDNNAVFNGAVQAQLALTKLGGAWLITGEKELKVYYVNK
jgi:ketosteroid isomerase-like protein